MSQDLKKQQQFRFLQIQHIQAPIAAGSPIPVSQNGVFILCSEFPLLKPSYNSPKNGWKRLSLIDHLLLNKNNNRCDKQSKIRI